MPLTADCLDRWLEDFDEFRLDFLAFCWEHAKALDYEFDFSQSILEAAHSAWKADNDLWLAECMGTDSSGLSHIKLMALLLHHLCRSNWIKEFREYPNNEFEFNGSAEQLQKTRKDFAGGPEAFMAFHFAVWVINWFEQVRIDRSEPFVFRITEDMAHDIMFYLLSKNCNQFGIVLIMKALYMRDPKRPTPSDPAS